MDEPPEFAVTDRAAPPPSPRRGLLAEIIWRLVYPFLRGERLAQQPATGFYTDTSVCIGCKACEVACKQWNQLPADGFSFGGRGYDNTRELSAESWRHVKFVEQFDTSGRIALDVVEASEQRENRGADAPRSPVSPDRWLMMSDVCKHCEAAPCQHACPTGAIVHNEFANVYIQADICNGCAYCVASCPFGVITRSHFDGHAHKCTLCYDRQREGMVPACAKSCPTASIQFGPVDELRERARRRVADLHARGQTKAYLYGDEETPTYSRLNSFYLLLDRPEVYGLPDQPFNQWLHLAGDYLRTAAIGFLGLAVLVAVILLGGR